MSAAKAGADTRFRALDGVRAFAALGVVCTHVGFVTGRALSNDWLGPILSRGDFGVTLFFLLSGFLLYRPFVLHSFGQRTAPRIGDYLWRRALRIFPALWVCVTVVVLVFTTYQVRWIDWLHYMLLIQVYDHHDYDPNLTQLWTLSVEIAFYVLLPVLAWLVTRGRRDTDHVLRRQLVLLAALVVASLVYGLIVNFTALNATQALLWLPGHLDWFAGGMFLAVLTCVPADATAAAGLRRVLTSWAGTRGTCWLVAAVVFLIATLPVGIPRTLAPALPWQWHGQHYLYLVSAFFILLPILLGPRARVDVVLGSGTSRLLANLSYSVYLWHVPLMLWWQRTLHFREFHGHFAALLALTLGSSLAVAAVSWFLVERPVLRHGPKAWRGRSVPPSAGGTVSRRQRARADSAKS